MKIGIWHLAWGKIVTISDFCDKVQVTISDEVSGSVYSVSKDSFP